MARRKKDPAANKSNSAIPQYITESKVLQERKITKRKLPSFTEAMMLLHAPEVLRLYWERIMVGLKEGDKASLEAAGEIFNYVRGKGMNVTLTQQLNQQSAVAGINSPVVGCDAFIRTLAEARANKAVAAAEVIDVEPVDSTAGD